ncbi:MAG: phosphopantetheine-binding protein [Thermodesulfobacteriota bacterium]|nr:phosphopantetheine-binding protein [Thermodesulfobacteriota bacterium]
MSDSGTACKTLCRSELGLTATYLRPGDETEERIAEIWQTVLNIDTIGTQDDYFEVGGDSMSATVIASALESRFACSFNPSRIIKYSTIAAQAAYIDQQQSNTDEGVAKSPACLTLVNEEGKKAPAFILHGNIGFTVYHPGFVDSFDKNQPIGFLEAPGIDGRGSPPERIEDYARLYLEAIRQVAPGGNWHIIANCAGSLIAIEMCLQAERQGEKVRSLGLIDPPLQAKRCAKQGVSPVWSLIWRVKDKHWRARRYQDLKNLLCGRPVRRPKRIERGDPAMAETLERLAKDGKLFPSHASYNAEALWKVSQALENAYWTYKLEQVWSGPAFIISANTHSKGLPFWKRYLPRVLFRVVEHDHRTLFTHGLGEIVRFVEDTMAPNPEERFHG